MTENENINQRIDRRLSVAPMMDWTDRHCRYLHRLISTRTLLYTEMVTAAAVVHGDAARLIGFHPAEHPVALQLGGSDPALLEQAVRIACDFGYDEINLNIGCPSDRVQSGAFGAVLMEKPALVAECAAAMITASSGAEITVKCRIGVDDQVPGDTLPAFLQVVSAVGVKNFTIHARKALLQGLSPKANRDVPPLDYPLVLAMKRQFSHLGIGINGGITSLDQAEGFLAQGLDGVMIGREAYHNPVELLQYADRRIFGSDRKISRRDIVFQMLPYIDAHLSTGGRLAHVTRHMLGLFSGQPGAKFWRRHLSEKAHEADTGPDILLAGLLMVQEVQNTQSVAV